MKHYKETVRQVIDKCTCDICWEDTDIPDNSLSLQGIDCTIQWSKFFNYWYWESDTESIDIDICYRCIGKVLQSIELRPEKKKEIDMFLRDVKDIINN